MVGASSSRAFVVGEHLLEELRGCSKFAAREQDCGKDGCACVGCGVVRAWMMKVVVLDNDGDLVVISEVVEMNYCAKDCR